MRRAAILFLVAVPSLALAYPSDHIDGSADELAAWDLISDGGRWIKVRELGEKALRARPDSHGAHYVLGVAMHYGEGDLARSVYHLTRSASLFEKKHGKVPTGDVPWRWHEAALRELAGALNEIDKPAEELDVLDRYDAAYTPKRNAQRVWPLMKLRRYEDARAAAKLAVASGSREQRNIARSDLCAAECEAGDRESAYRACIDATSDFRARNSGGQVEFSNASESAISVYKFDEAERLLAESTRRAIPDSWGNPFQHLAMLYLTEARIGEAIEALKGGQALALRRAAWLDQHGRARLDQTIAMLLLVAGHTERAMQIAVRAQARPDRQGVHSGTEGQAAVASAILVAVTQREQAARAEEDVVTANFLEGLRLRVEAARLRISAWRQERQAAVLLANEGFLLRSLRPYYVGGADLPEWLMPEIVDVVGAGVSLRALEQARAVEKYGASSAYFDALEAEAHFNRHDWAKVLPAAERALARLPHAEALLEGRVAAMAAEASRREGDLDRAVALFARALTKDPGVIRRLGLSLPVRLESDGSAVAEAAAKLVEKSPRFRIAKGGHIVALAGGGKPQACLYGPRHEMIQCADLKIAEGTEQPDDDKTLARKLVAELHRVAFAIKADLSQADLTSLDGSPTAARADKQVRTLLDTLGPATP
jgi:tetratricopeptide (TPR) repeat protein